MALKEQTHTRLVFFFGLKCLSSLLPQGKNFVGDLLTDGKIRWVETGQIFNSPSAWATHCKRLVNPAKKSGCGWASVRYRGQKLVQYKTTWLHKYQPSADLVRISHLMFYFLYYNQHVPNFDLALKRPKGASKQLILISFSANKN